MVTEGVHMSAGTPFNATYRTTGEEDMSKLMVAC